jgi:hypothetical protein
MKQFQAYASGVYGVVADSPKAAALLFFETYPTKRKCNLIEGIKDGHFFSVTYGRASDGNWPQSFKDITKKGAALLPE